MFRCLYYYFTRFVRLVIVMSVVIIIIIFYLLRYSIYTSVVALPYDGKMRKTNFFTIKPWLGFTTLAYIRNTESTGDANTFEFSLVSYSIIPNVLFEPSRQLRSIDILFDTRGIGWNQRPLNCLPIAATIIRPNRIDIYILAIDRIQTCFEHEANWTNVDFTKIAENNNPIKQTI